MIFCPKCGSLLKPKKDGSKTVMFCSCGFTNKDVSSTKISESSVKKKDEAKFAVVGSEEDSVLPLTNAECPKCGHKKAFYWLVQTRAGDEPETKFLRCEKCRHTWRDYQ